MAQGIGAKEIGTASWGVVSGWSATGGAIAASSLGFSLMLFPGLAQAQPIPDNSLAPDISTVSPDPSNPLQSWQIGGGSQRGENLFHSFLQFDVDAGQTVYFLQPGGVSSIFSRVTGPDASTLDGTLGVLGNANLFFLNPQGIVFGQNAQLDISGSFLATTAEAFDWGNGLQFSAVNPQAAPLLNLSIQPGLQYGSSVGAIAQGTLRSQAKLSVGGDLQLSGQQLNLTGALQAGGNLTLTAQQAVQLDQIQLDTALPQGETGAAGQILVEGTTVLITGRSQLNAEALGNGNGGQIQLRAKERLELSSPPPPGEPASSSFMTINSSAQQGRAGDILFQAPEVVLDNVDAFAKLKRNGEGRSGDITVLADVLTTKNATDLYTDSEGLGRAGDITLQAKQIQLTQGTELWSRLLRQGEGRSGDIRLIAETAEIKDGSRLFSDSDGKGDAGLIQFQVDNLALSGGSQIWSRLLGSGVGRGGDIQVEGDSVTMIEGARMFADSSGDGKAGDITFNLTGALTMEGGARVASSGSNRGGVAGLLTFNVGSLEVDESFITSRINTRGGINGEGRNNGIVVNATGDVRLSNGGLFTDARENAKAPAGDSAGDIVINAQNLTVQNNGRIQGGSIGLTGGGQILLNARDTVRVENQGWVLNRSGASATGDAKSLEIRAQRVELIDEGKVESSTQARVSGGDVIIIAPEVLVKNQSQILTDTTESGKAGNIEILAAGGSVSILEDGLISSSVADGSGAGGDITVRTGLLTLASGGRIEAQTEGVNFRLLAEQLRQQNQSYNDLIEAANPIAYWTLDETNTEGSVNRVGDRFNGTYEGNVDPTVPGISGSAARFDGRNGAIRINDSLDLNLSSIAIEAWVKLDPEDVPREQVLFSAHETNDLRRSLHVRVYNDGAAYLGLWDNDLRTPSGKIPADGQWHHVVAQVFYNPDSDQIAGPSATRLDIDGVEAAVGTRGPFEGENAISRIGAWRSPTDQTFKGSIDEVAVYRLDQLPQVGNENNIFDLHYVAGILGQNRSIDELDALLGEASSGNIVVEADVVNISGVTARPEDRDTRNADTKGISSGLFSGTQRELAGAGGTITVTARQALNLSDGGLLSSTTTGQADAGSIAVRAGQVNLERGGQLLTTSRGAGKAGSIEVQAEGIQLSGLDPLFDQHLETLGDRPDRLDVDGPASGFFARATGSGVAGDIQVTETGQLSLQDGAQIAVSSDGLGDGGGLNLRARQILLDGGSQLTARTAQGQGGNITLAPQELLVLRNGSQILTDSQGIGNGGNITIDNRDGFIVAVPQENSDITANANRGNGGSIQITTGGLFGLEFRDQPTLGSDITATSTFGLNGNVTVDVLNIDPSQGLTALPTNLVDPSNQIAQSCSSDRLASSQFVVTGRGGLPLTPTAPLRHHSLASQWIYAREGTVQAGTVQAEAMETEIPATETPAIATSVSQARGKPLQEAQGWFLSANGTVQLAAATHAPMRASHLDCARRLLPGDAPDSD